MAVMCMHCSLSSHRASHWQTIRLRAQAFILERTAQPDGGQCSLKLVV